MASGATKTEAKKSPYGLGCSQNRGQKGIEFKKKKNTIWPQVQPKPRPKRAHMASGAAKTEAKGRVYGLGCWKIEAEAPSMASVLNRGQKL